MEFIRVLVRSPALRAALLSGLTGGLHCAAMCGGIATSFPAMGPRGDLRYVIEPNLGRVPGYVIAGAVAGGIGGGIVPVARSPWLGVWLRVAVGLVLVDRKSTRLNFSHYCGDRIPSADCTETNTIG